MWSSRVAEQAAQQCPGAAVQTNSTSTAMAVLPLCQVTAHGDSSSRARPAAWEAPGHGEEADWEHFSGHPSRGHTTCSAVMTIHNPVLSVLG